MGPVQGDAGKGPFRDTFAPLFFLSFAAIHPLTAFRKSPEAIGVIIGVLAELSAEFSSPGHRCYHRCLSGFSAGFSRQSLAVFLAVFPGLAPFCQDSRKTPTAFFYDTGKTPRRLFIATAKPGVPFLSEIRQNPFVPFLSEIPQNPRLFWVEFGCDPPAPSLALGLNKSQHGAAATLPFVGAANHRGGRCKR